MGQGHDAKASTLGDSCRFSEECTRDRNFDFSMLVMQEHSKKRENHCILVDIGGHVF